MRNRKRNNSIALWLFLLAFMGSFRLFAVESVILHLANGDRLSGTIVSENATEVVINAGLLGKITVPLSQISKRDILTVTPPAAVAAPQTNNVATATTNAPGAALATQVPANVTQIPVKPAPTPKPKEWNAEIQLGTNIRYSTTDSRDYLATAKGTYAHNHLRETLDYSFFYGRTEGLISANRMTGSSKTDYDLSKRIYMYNLGGAGYDEVQKIDLQYEVGPGLGYNLLTLTNFVWKTEFGFSYQDRFRSDQTEQVTYSARIGEIFSWKVWSKLVADAKLEYFANLQSLGNYRLRLEGVLRYPVFKNVSLNVNVIDLYDTLPAAGVSKNDFQIRSALGLKF